LIFYVGCWAQVSGISLVFPQVDKETNKVTDEVAFGYEIEYTKLFEDSLSMNFNVPIVGLLG